MIFIVHNIISVIADDGLALALASLSARKRMEDSENNNIEARETKTIHSICILGYSFNAIHIRDTTPIEMEANRGGKSGTNEKKKNKSFGVYLQKCMYLERVESHLHIHFNGNLLFFRPLSLPIKSPSLFPPHAALRSFRSRHKRQNIYMYIYVDVRHQTTIWEWVPPSLLAPALATK